MRASHMDGASMIRRLLILILLFAACVDPRVIGPTDGATSYGFGRNGTPDDIWPRDASAGTRNDTINPADTTTDVPIMPSDSDTAESRMHPTPYQRTLSHPTPRHRIPSRPCAVTASLMPVNNVTLSPAAVQPNASIPQVVPQPYSKAVLRMLGCMRHDIYRGNR